MRKTVVLLLASLLLASAPVHGSHVLNPAEENDSVGLAVHDCSDGGGPGEAGNALEALYVGTGHRTADWDGDDETDPDARNLVLFQVVFEERDRVNRLDPASIHLSFQASDEDATNLPQQKVHTITVDYAGGAPGEADWTEAEEDNPVSLDVTETSFADVPWIEVKDGSANPPPSGDDPPDVTAPTYRVLELGLFPYQVFLHEDDDLATGPLVLDSWTVATRTGTNAGEDSAEYDANADECGDDYVEVDRTVSPAPPTLGREAEGEEEEDVPPIQADPSIGTRDPESVITFTANVFSGGGSPDLEGYTYDWTFVNGDFTTTSTAEAPEVHFPNLDPVVVTLVVTDDLGTASATYQTESGATEVTMNNLAPVADFSLDTQAPVVDQPIAFTDRTTDPDGDPIASWKWDFGDGSDEVTTQNPSHAFAATGSYTVTLTATDAPPAGFEGQAMSDERTFEVFVCTEADAQAQACKAPNAGPTASFLPDKTEVDEGETVTFTDTSEDRDGTVVAWHWDFGDGTTSAERNPTHAYETVGTYSVTLTVTDDGGLQGTRAFPIRVLLVEPEPAPPKELLAPPIADFTFDEEAIVGEAVGFTDASTAEAKLVAWTWLFGDGSDPEFGSKVEHTFEETGTFRVTLTVEDETGVRDTTSKLVLVGEEPDEESPGLPLAALLVALGVVAVARRAPRRD